MSKDKALEMAIEAMTSPNNLSFLMAITACKEALEQPAQEPVAVITPDNYGEPRLDFIVTFKYKATTAVNPDIFLYIHPAPSWQGLSDDERFIIVQNADWDNPCDIAELIEQALKEKNNG